MTTSSWTGTRWHYFLTPRLERVFHISPKDSKQSIRRNDASGLNDGDHLVHLLLERQVHRTPNNVAIVCGAASLTYSQLNAKANQLAHHLRALGVRPGTFVGICVPRS